MSLTARNGWPAVGADTRDTSLSRAKMLFHKTDFFLWLLGKKLLYFGIATDRYRPILLWIQGSVHIIYFLFLAPVRHPASFGQRGDLFCIPTNYRISLEPQPKKHSLMAVPASCQENFILFCYLKLQASCHLSVAKSTPHEFLCGFWLF